MIALDGRFGYSFLAGIGAAINPCGFVLLPAYLMYFLGLEGTQPGSQRASLQRALLVSAAMSAGFISVFFVVGTITRLFTSVIEENAKYAGFGIGIAMIVLGCFLLAGWKPPFAMPEVGQGKQRTQTFVSMFGFGVAYAVASIGCALPLLVAVIFGSFGVHGFLSGVLGVVLYGAGMALLVAALTISLALASGWLLRVLRSAMKYMDRVAAIFVMATGFYLSWYWFTDITERSSDGLRSRGERWQNRVLNFFTDRGPWPLLIVFGAIVIGAVAFVIATRPREHRQG